MSLMNPRGQPSSGKKAEPTMPMPRASNVPQPRPQQVPEPIYDDEVLRRYQKDLDRERLLLALEQERDTWRRQYLTEKAERERLEMLSQQQATAHEQAVAKLCAERDAKIEKLEHARDDYRVKLKEFETECTIGGNGVLDLAGAVAKNMQRLLEKIKNEHEAPEDVAGAVGLATMAAIANEIEHHQANELPKVVRDGPASEEETRRHE